MIERADKDGIVLLLESIMQRQGSTGRNTQRDGESPFAHVRTIHRLYIHGHDGITIVATHMYRGSADAVTTI